MKMSIDVLYSKYRKLGYSHIEAIRKIQADMRLSKLSSILS